MLEYGAEAVYYCDDIALQSRCLKTSIIRQFTLVSDTALQSHTGKDLYCLLGYSCTFKRATVYYFSPFTRRTMIINKQAC